MSHQSSEVLFTLKAGRVYLLFFLLLLLILASVVYIVESAYVKDVLYQTIYDKYCWYNDKCCEDIYRNTGHCQIENSCKLMIYSNFPIITSIFRDCVNLYY